MAAPLPDGRVLLLVGGDLNDDLANEPEIWDPRTGQGAPLPGFEKKVDQQPRDLAEKRAKER